MVVGVTVYAKDAWCSPRVRCGGIGTATIRGTEILVLLFTSTELLSVTWSYVPHVVAGYHISRGHPVAVSSQESRPRKEKKKERCPERAQAVLFDKPSSTMYDREKHEHKRKHILAITSARLE